MILKFDHSIIWLLTSESLRARFSYLVILLFIIASCTERIDINTDASPPQLVIYGHLTTDVMQHAISITRSSGYFDTTKPAGISYATVTISGGGQTFTLTESATEAGLYLTDANVCGIEGQTYTLNVSLDFNNDGQAEHYTATSYLPRAAQLDTIVVRPSPDYKDFIGIHMFGFTSPEKECYYSFHAFRNDVAMTDSLTLFALYDSDLIGVDEMYDVGCYYLDQTKEQTELTPGDRVFLRLDVLTKEYGKFLENAQGEVWGASPFSGPPANVKSNIVCASGNQPAAISGYFSAYSSRISYTVWEGF